MRDILAMPEHPVFQIGDIIQGTEGAGTTWCNRATLLLVYVDPECNTSVSAVVLDYSRPRDSSMPTKLPHTTHGSWRLDYRKWKKIGEVLPLKDSSYAIRGAQDKWGTESCTE